MKSKYWIKLYQEILRDPKMGKLPDNLWRRCVESFLLAGDLREGGFLPTLTDMAWILRRDEQTLHQELSQLAAVDIVSLRDYNPFEKRWFVNNFEDRQGPSDAAQRMREMRKRKRKEKETKRKEKERDTYTETDSDVMFVTYRNNTVTDREEGMTEDQQKKIWNGIVDVIETFSAETNIDIPDLFQPSGEVREKWVAPASKLMLMVNDNPEEAIRLVKETIKRFNREGLTYSCPGSLVNVARTVKLSSQPAWLDDLWQKVVLWSERKLPLNDFATPEIKQAINTIGERELRNGNRDQYRGQFFELMKSAEANT